MPKKKKKKKSSIHQSPWNDLLHFSSLDVYGYDYLCHQPLVAPDLSEGNREISITDSHFTEEESKV